MDYEWHSCWGNVWHFHCVLPVSWPVQGVILCKCFDAICIFWTPKIWHFNGSVSVECIAAKVLLDGRGSTFCFYSSGEGQYCVMYRIFVPVECTCNVVWRDAWMRLCLSVLHCPVLLLLFVDFIVVTAHNSLLSWCLWWSVFATVINSSPAFFFLLPGCFRHSGVCDDGVFVSAFQEMCLRNVLKGQTNSWFGDLVNKFFCSVFVEVSLSFGQSTKQRWQLAASHGPSGNSFRTGTAKILSRAGDS